MNKNKKNNFLEIEALNLNEIKYLKPKKNINFKFIFHISFFLLNLIFLLIVIYKIYMIINIKKIIYNKIFKINQLGKNVGKELKNKNTRLIEKLNKIEKKLEIINENQLIYQNKFNIYNLLISKEVFGHKKIRIGKKGDGGYVILDDLKKIKIAYSFGIAREISFDKEIADKNIDVFMYDHTIKGIPFKNSRFHWKKIGLKGINTNDNNNKLKTLPELLEKNGHSKENNMILKLDIESYEWDVFKYLPFKVLNQFKYIVGEFHFSNKKPFNYYSILKRIQKTHSIFHLHCNNCGEIIDLEGYKICELLEISFALKTEFQFIEFTNEFPIEGVDYKNCPNRIEISSILNFS